MEPGELKIEYQADGNVIQVYNSLKVCSLVINGEVVDRYTGLVAGKFVLHGFADRDGELIPVEAKMGAAFMRLYYDGELVAKRFMMFG